MNPWLNPEGLRFLKHVRLDGAHWLWTGGTRGDGYGQFRRVGGVSGRRMTPQRAAYEIHHGVKLPRSTDVRHGCDREGCIAPTHSQAVKVHQIDPGDLKEARRQYAAGVWDLRQFAAAIGVKQHHLPDPQGRLPHVVQ